MLCSQNSALYTVSSGRITQIILFRPKSVNNCLNNSPNHFRSVNWTSVVLHCQVRQTLCKPEIPKVFSGRVEVGNLLPGPKGPRIEKIQDRPPGLKISSEIDNFQASHPPNTHFLWEFWRSRLKFSSEIDFFQSFGP